MEALSSSIILPAFQESHSSNRHPSLRTTLSFSKTTARLSAVAAAASRQVSGDSEDDQQQHQQQQVLDLHNAFDGVIGKTNSNEDLNKKTSADGKKGVIGKTNSNEDLNKKTSEDGKKGVIGQTNSNEDLNKKTSEVGTGGSTRAGLFRTPISGGVQSATSVHDLPKPALAVRNLMEQARFAHLSTVMSRMHQRSEGYPFGSLVDFAPDPMGHPIFSFSQLGIHTRNLLANPRCTLVVQIPGWSGLSNARVTIFGDVYPLAEDEQEWAHKQYIAKHQQAPSQQWGNFYYFRMHNISDIYFIGGFGTVAWVNVKEYEALQPDDIAVNGGEQNLKELNVMFSKPLKDLISLESQVDDVSLISIDSKGTDIRVRQGAQFHIQRLVFEEWDGIKTLEEAKAALWNLVNKGGVYTVHK